MCSCHVKPLLIIVKPPQVSSLDPQEYLGVVLVVVFVSAKVSASIFSERPHTPILSLLFTQYFVVVLVESAYTRCDVIGAVFIDSIWTWLGVNQQTSSYCRINAIIAIVVGGGHEESTTFHACHLVVGLQFHCWICFCCCLLCPCCPCWLEILMPLCGLVHTFWASSSINFSTLSTSCHFPPYLTVELVAKGPQTNNKKERKW